MPPAAVHLPAEIREEAVQWADSHHVSLDQFVVWAVAEKVARLKRGLEDPRFPQVVYRMGAARWPTPVVRGTGIRVQTLVIAHRSWRMSASEIADEYDLTESQVRNALAFYEAHRQEIDAAIESEDRIELTAALNRFLSEMSAEDVAGQVFWLNPWRRDRDESGSRE